MARIPGFHPGGPGSIPGVGENIFNLVDKQKHQFEWNSIFFTLKQQYLQDKLK